MNRFKYLAHPLKESPLTSPNSSVESFELLLLNHGSNKSHRSPSAYTVTKVADTHDFNLRLTQDEKVDEVSANKLKRLQINETAAAKYFLPKISCATKLNSMKNLPADDKLTCLMDGLIERAKESSFYSTATLEIFLHKAVRAEGDFIRVKNRDYSEFRYLINGLEHGDFVACSSIADSMTWEGGYGEHLFCLLRRYDKILWIEGNSNQSVLFKRHTAKQWFKDITMRDYRENMDDVNKQYFSRFDLTNWQNRSQCLLDVLANRPEDQDLLMRSEIRTFRKYVLAQSGGGY
jgi:hypothetical protein